MNKRILVGRASLIGDTIMALPMLNYFESLYPNSYKIWPIAKKCSQNAPLYLHHPLIDKVYVLEEQEGFSKKDIEYFNSCDIKINCFPQHPDGMPATTPNSFWWNKYTCLEETWRMAGLSLDDLYRMPKESRKPRLYKWFDIEQIDKSITIWPFAGYNNEQPRNPSANWTNQLLKLINKEFPDYKIYHCGWTTEPDVSEGINNFYRKTDLSFFEQIKLTLGTNLCINTDSGSGWVIGAYGHLQISID